MHYYKRNLGDYAKKAGRLSMLQHGAYTLLIDACYDREQFPTMQEAIDWAWASSSAEIEAVEFVLRKFFVLEDGRYTQSRISDELNDYRTKAETNARIAHDRETKRKESATNRARSVNEPTPNQEPRTTNQEPLTKEDQEHLVTDVTDAAVNDFESLWKLYPRKTAKAEAQKAWAKLSPDHSLVAEIAAGLAAHIACADWVKDDGKYIPHGATWLNQRRWQDEVKPASNVIGIATASRHHDFDKRDYSEGLELREDGTNGF
jgi:uncharacterized protein YdaU (DUF1376 family)